MIDKFNDINPLLLLLCIVVTWNFFKYKNQYLISILLIVSFFCYYESESKTKKYSTIEKTYTLKSDSISFEDEAKKIQQLSAKFVSKYGGLPTNYNNMDFTKMPNKYIYILRNKELFINLLNLRFIGKLHEFGYARLFGILEVFLKTYYKIITKTSSLTNIDNLKELHLLFHNLHQELLYNSPISNLKYNLTLHDLINSNMKVISIFMIRKIRIVKALIDDKIK